MPTRNETLRRDELLRKLRAGVISKVEALELTDILEEERDRARERGDMAALVAIALGLALLAAIVAKR